MTAPRTSATKRDDWSWLAACSVVVCRSFSGILFFPCHHGHWPSLRTKFLEHKFCASRSIFTCGCVFRGFKVNKTGATTWKNRVLNSYFRELLESFMYEIAGDANITPSLRAFVESNWMRGRFCWISFCVLVFSFSLIWIKAPPLSRSHCGRTWIVSRF